MLACVLWMPGYQDWVIVVALSGGGSAIEGESDKLLDPQWQNLLLIFLVVKGLSGEWCWNHLLS